MRKFAVLLSLLLLFTPAVDAQQCTRNCVYEYDDFSGGLNLKMSPFSLQKSEGDILENLRFDTEYKSLTKRDTTKTACTADADGPITGLHRFYMKDGTKITLVNYGNKILTCDDSTGLPTTIFTVDTADNRWDWLTWHDIAIGTDGVNQPIKYDGSSTSATYLGAALATDAGSGSGPNGTYSYETSCYTASYEISLGTASNEITVSDNDINLTMIPICPDTILGESVIGRKIYRPSNGDTTYKLVSDVGDSLGTIPNNTATTTTDSDADGALGAAISATATYAAPLGRFGVLHKNRLWLGNNSTTPSRLYYSEDASHDYFRSDAYFNIRPNDGDEITFIKNWLGLLTVSKNNTIQKMDTREDDPDTDWAITDPFSFVGCQAPYSAIETDLGIMYLANNGVYNFTGQYSELISDKVTPTIRDIQASNFPTVWAEYFKNSYYMTYTSTATGSAINDRILVIDLIDKAFSIDLFNANVLHVFSSGSDVEALYSGASNSGLVYAHTETVKEIVHKTHDDFDGTWDDMRYIPTSVGGDSDSPVIELAWTATLDSVTDADWTSTINSMATAGSVIDRPDFDGTYTSPYLTINASALDKLYWKETFPSGGGDITFDIRMGATTLDTSLAAWNTGYTDSTGSDISEATSTTDAVYMQYRINATTDTITETPTLFRESNYVVRVTFDIAGSTEETAIPIRYRSGWNDFGIPGYVKELRKIYVYYEWPDDTAGTLNLTFTSIQGETDSFAIDLLEYPDYYIEYFPDGNLVGELIRLEIDESSATPVKIEKIIVVYDVEEDLT